MRLSLARRAALVGVAVGALVLTGAPPALAADTGTISGRLTTSSGAGAADVPVQVYQGNHWQYIAEAHTDSDGNWAIDGLDAGPYVVSYLPSDHPQQYYRQKSKRGDADDVIVTPGATTTADDQLMPTGFITGRITDTAGQPVVDLPLTAIEVDSTANPWASGRTDAEGRYRMIALPGRYRIRFYPIEGSYQAQYMPGKIDWNEAGQYKVTADAETVADETVLPVGSISGRFTSASGAPLGPVNVSLAGAETWSDDTGAFTFPTLLAGSYKVRYTAGNREQYHRGKLDHGSADAVVVRGGEQTSIEDSLLGIGSVRISAVDSVTGEPVPNFCVNSEYTSEAACSGGTGQATLYELPQGRHDLHLYAPDKLHFTRQVTNIRVIANQTTALAPKLRPGAVVTTTVVDRATGAPLAGVCVNAFLNKQAAPIDGQDKCSDLTGSVRIGPLVGGTYRLFADPNGYPEYGRQWVGATGGTGDERQAATFSAPVGAVSTGPQVRIDPAGTVSGTVTDAVTGEPVKGAGVSVLIGHPGVGFSDATTNGDGRYTLERLGPYAWPLVFSGSPYATHWSGNAPSRFTATPVTVTAGRMATHDTALRRGSTVDGTFTNQDGVAFRDGRVTARSADTGDIAGYASLSAGRFTLPVTGSQRIFFTYEVTFAGEEDGYSGRYLVTAADGVRRVGLFSVPATGTLPVSLVVPTS
ncbi:carboxypeptidase regulatory-like domain-containing protein [Micromonospora sp. RTGN7]|uniref:carboxypeptidase regulatory-like domain-containing protein n=1 Tax=Micromonospora sp. RTGN7 TaxID=3016526 RepID=UPI0029FF3DE6|nr:carboxypeptidase regulatory-like domain-containing protein [Micromonospora sp. RTGN7]